MIDSEISSRLSAPSITPLPAPGGSITDISAHGAWFAEYAAYERSLCERDPSPMSLKLRHTELVTAAARGITESEDFPPPMARACLLAAQYHDLGRFEQYRLFGTFRDRDSVNHAELSAFLIEKYGLLTKEAYVARAVLGAVRLHNVYRLPEDLPSDVRVAARLVRDADKLDILRVMDEELSGSGDCPRTVVLNQPDDPSRFSQKVIGCALRGEVASYD
ncbi:MAG: HD domain-containing protein, partial [Desulfovibrio sp.]|nr:HD domain-containing protein [Desulfovibrio sp.]